MYSLYSLPRLRLPFGTWESEDSLLQPELVRKYYLLCTLEEPHTHELRAIATACTNQCNLGAGCTISLQDVDFIDSC